MDMQGHIIPPVIKKVSVIAHNQDGEVVEVSGYGYIVLDVSPAYPRSPRYKTVLDIHVETDWGGTITRYSYDTPPHTFPG